jgi:putative hydrolase
VSNPGNPFGAFGDDDDPMAAMGAMFGDLSRLLSGSGDWESAAQIAAGVASEGRPEANVDPADRIQVEQLARAVEVQMDGVAGVSIPGGFNVEALNRSQWAKRFLDDHRSLLSGIADSLGGGLAAGFAELGDPDQLSMPGMESMGVPPEMLRQVMRMMGPMLLQMMAGSTAGHLAVRTLGHYELPLPRPVSAPSTMVLNNVDSFASDWELPVDGIRFWVLLSDAAHQSVLGIPHVADRITGLVGDYTSAFATDPEVIERQAGDLGLDEMIGDSMGDIESIQNLAGNPDAVLGAMQSDRQRAIIPELVAVSAVVGGWVDHILDKVGAPMIAEYPSITEALRRRRVEAGPQTRFVERLFGLELSQVAFDRGGAFINGVIDRADESALKRLWNEPENLPTATELDAPGLWMARVGIESRDLPMEDFEIPDAPNF